jgi:hypothetical protein
MYIPTAKGYFSGCGEMDREGLFKLNNADCFRSFAMTCSTSACLPAGRCVPMKHTGLRTQGTMIKDDLPGTTDTLI